jgi:hypothetical protein
MSLIARLRDVITLRRAARISIIGKPKPFPVLTKTTARQSLFKELFVFVRNTEAKQNFVFVAQSFIQLRLSWDGNRLRKLVVGFIGLNDAADIIGKDGDRVRATGDRVRSTISADGN